MFFRDAEKSDLPAIRNLVLRAHEKDRFRMFLFQWGHPGFQIVSVLLSVLTFIVTSSFLWSGGVYLGLGISLAFVVLVGLRRHLRHHFHRISFLEFPRAYRRNGGRFLLGEMDGKIVAICGLLDRGGASMEMTSLVVDPSQRRRGVAKKMVAEAVRWGRWEGKSALGFEILNSNLAALALLSIYHPKKVSHFPGPSKFHLVAFRFFRYRIELENFESVEFNGGPSRLWSHWLDNQSFPDLPEDRFHPGSPSD